ncbi:MAG: DUF1573 domain-containing protein [candidate division WOR-3 bacterium]
MKRIIKIFATLILLINWKNLQATPSIKFKVTEINFGKMEQRTQKTHIFKFTNEGDDTLIIEKVRSTCGCTGAILSSPKISPGGSGSVEVTFSSNSYIGEVSKGVKVHSNDPEKPIIELKIKANVLPPLITLNLFSPKNCNDYNFIKKNILGPLEKKYRLKVNYFEINFPINYERLIEFEKQLNERRECFPILVIGNSILGGKEEIEGKLEMKIRDCFYKNCELPKIEVDKVIPINRKEALPLFYFYDVENKCRRASYELKYLEYKFPFISVKRLNIKDKKNRELYEKMCESFKVEKLKVSPILFIKNEFLTEENIRVEKIKEIIEKD